MGDGVQQQMVSYDLWVKYRDGIVTLSKALENRDKEKEYIRNENIELVRDRDDIVGKMSQDFASLFHKCKKATTGLFSILHITLENYYL